MGIFAVLHTSLRLIDLIDSIPSVYSSAGQISTFFENFTDLFHTIVLNVLFNSEWNGLSRFWFSHQGAEIFSQDVEPRNFGQRPRKLPDPISRCTDWENQKLLWPFHSELKSTLRTILWNTSVEFSKKVESCPAKLYTGGIESIKSINRRLVWSTAKIPILLPAEPAHSAVCHYFSQTYLGRYSWKKYCSFESDFDNTLPSLVSLNV